MRILAIAIFLVTTSAQAANDDVKMLTPEECSHISKLPSGEFYINDPVKIDFMTIHHQNVSPRSGIAVNGVDSFDVIQRSCFNKNPN
jgi:hypothetical protein